MERVGAMEILDARLRRAGEWLLVGYTVLMVLVTFGGTERRELVPESPVAVETVFPG
jgi:hypothetical protein